jgi:hypothetical protein
MQPRFLSIFLIIFNKCNYLAQPVLGSFLRALLAKRRRGGSFFGQSPKNEPHFPFSASEATVAK